ncbi:hypothetical protein [Streptomyces sp. NPDC003006]
MDLEQVLLLVPDVGQLLVAVAARATPLAVARGAHTVRAALRGQGLLR